MKVKVGGAHQGSTRLAAIGMVARDHHSMVHVGIAQQIAGTHTAESTEACAFLALTCLLLATTSSDPSSLRVMRHK
ncbi:hypothetical protein V6N13_141983 [Hibiscus sabdariffa]|uniref:Uncharacterized protein n=1 Tax=Hibiscus sabdariffa TaxID=183260 RepID=A0ABR2FCU4_9ROSI